MKRVFLMINISIVIYLSQPDSLIGAAGDASKTVEIPSNESPKLNLGDDISSTIYRQSTTDSDHSLGVLISDYSVHSSFGFYKPSELVLRNQYFIVDYSKNISNISGIIVGPEMRLWSSTFVDLKTFVHFGFFYAQGIFQVESESGLTLQDEVALQWIPVQGGLEVSSRPMTTYGLSIGVAASIGSDWMTQTGKLDGMNQSFVVPRYEYGPSLGVFSREKANNVGFDGLRIAIKKYSAVNSNQQSQGVLADLGAKYVF